MANLKDLSMTILPLDYFREVMGIRPYAFWQMTSSRESLAGCEYVYYWERWRKRRIGRQDCIRAVNRAETYIYEFLTTFPGPKYKYRDKVRIVKPRQAARYQPNPYTLTTRWKRIIDVGIKTWTLIDDDVDISSAYNINSDEVEFTVTVGASVLESEVTVVYVDTQVPIRPISVSISGTTATITIHKWLLGEPDDWKTSDTIDADVAANLLQSVDVYRVWINASEQIILAWEPGYRRCGIERGGSSQLCQRDTVNACAVEHDYRLGITAWQAATYSNGSYTRVSWPQARHPDCGFISYVSGIDPDDDTYMSPYWQDIVAHLGVALLDTSVCGCEDEHEAFRYYQMDLGHQKESGAYQLSSSMLENPGMNHRRGVIDAWAAMKREVEVANG